MDHPWVTLGSPVRHPWVAHDFVVLVHGSLMGIHEFMAQAHGPPIGHPWLAHYLVVVALGAPYGSPMSLLC